MEAVALVGLTSLAGYFLSSKSKKDSKLLINQVGKDIQPNQFPVSTNIYNSHMYESANDVVLNKSLQNYKDSQNPSQTNVLPPIYNSYSMTGSELGRLSELTSVNSQMKSNINDINRRLDVSSDADKTVNNDNLKSRPMFETSLNTLELFHNTENFTNFNNELGINTEISLLTGKPIQREHANMVPFFGSNQKQNVDKHFNSILDNHTGNTSTFFHKKEVGQYFGNVKQDIHGTPILTENIDKDRYIPSVYKQNEKPFYEERVAAPIGFTVDNPLTDASISHKNIDQLRVANKPQISYEARMNSGKFGELQATRPNQVKNRVDGSFELSPDHYFNGPGAITGRKQDENFGNIAPTSRQDQNIEYYGTADSNYPKTMQRINKNVDNSESIFNSDYTDSKRQQVNYEKEYLRNLQNVNLNPETDDFNKNTYTAYSQERETSSKQHSLNINKADSGHQTYLQDAPRGTIKESTLTDRHGDGYIKTDYDLGKSNAYELGITDIDLKTTHKENTLIEGYKGVANRNEEMGYKIKEKGVKAKTTNKEMNNFEYSGNAKTQNYSKGESRKKYDNAEISNKKEKLLKNSRPNGKNTALKTIGAGKKLIGKVKSTSNMLLKEQEKERTENFKSVNPVIPTKVNIGKSRQFHNKNSQIDRFSNRKSQKKSRFNAGEIQGQLKNNPFYNLN